MNFEQSILDIKNQLRESLQIENKKNLKKAESFVLVGMGGSALAGGIVKGFAPSMPLAVQRSYGLPEGKEKSLFIFSSYSGNTEEVLDSFKKAKKLKRAVISKGGALIKMAEKEKVPYIKLPDTNLQPRMALGLSVNALFKLLGLKDKELAKTGENINPASYEKEGIILSKKIKGFIPLIYSSDKNSAIAYNLKIKINENAKSPAFYNEIPESNHNEISGFNKKTIKFSKNILIIFLKDSTDHPRIKRRMEITERMYREEGYKSLAIELEGKNFLEKYFGFNSLSDWTTFHLAKSYGFDPKPVPAIEKLKKSL